MNWSRGNVYFHRLFSVEELGFGRKSIEPFVGPLIKKFLAIGEAVAARWIEMPEAILLFQMVPGIEDSGAIYLYDRGQQVFYLLCFDGPDDHLTLEEFEELMEEYQLLRFAEQPWVIDQQPPMPVRAAQEMPMPSVPVPPRSVMSDVAPEDGGRVAIKVGEWLQPRGPDLKRVWFQNAGVA